MDLQVAYFGRSAVRRAISGLAVTLAPNLRRDRVSFVGTLRSPLRFREAISALHDVVISDLRFKPKDHTAYRDWLVEQKKREEELRRATYQAAKQQAKAERKLTIPKGFGEVVRNLLQRRREQLRLPDRRPRRLQRRAGRRPRHHQRRLFLGALRRVPETAELSANAVQRRSGRLRGANARGTGLP